MSLYNIRGQGTSLETARSSFCNKQKTGAISFSGGKKTCPRVLTRRSNADGNHPTQAEDRCSYEGVPRESGFGSGTGISGQARRDF